MKALNIKQPYANQILSGEKTEEFRRWKTAFRGDFVVVSSKNPAIEPAGCAICLAELYDVKEYEKGDYGFLLRNIRPLENIPVRGKLKFFDVPDELVKVKGV